MSEPTREAVEAARTILGLACIHEYGKDPQGPFWPKAAEHALADAFDAFAATRDSRIAELEKERDLAVALEKVAAKTQVETCNNAVARIAELEKALGVAQEAMNERRGYCEKSWGRKYGEEWDEEDAIVARALSPVAPRVCPTCGSVEPAFNYSLKTHSYCHDPFHAPRPTPEGGV